MDKDFIIQRGDTAKYHLTITHDDFSMKDNDFFVLLWYGMFEQYTKIEKSDMYCDEEGDWFMLFPSAPALGKVKAECHYFVPDSDEKTGIREEVDYQYIGFVTSNPCPKFECNCVCDDQDRSVKYERVYDNDVKTLYLNVRTADGEPVYTSEGEQVRVRKEQINYK